MQSGLETHPFYKSSEIGVDPIPTYPLIQTISAFKLWLVMTGKIFAYLFMLFISLESAHA
jgi:hypothetical protein